MLAAVLGFQPVKLVVGPDGMGEVNVTADSGQVRVIGVDLILEYDPAKLEIKNVVDSGELASASAKIVDNKSGIAKLAYSNGQGEYDKGKISLARVGLKLKEGQNRAELKIKYVPGNTRDSNIVTLHGEDILKSTEELTVVRKGEVLGAEAPAVEYADLSWMVVVGVALLLMGTGFWILVTVSGKDR